MVSLIKNIGRLYVVPPGPVSGREMGTCVRVIEQAALVIDGETIAWFGPETELQSATAANQWGEFTEDNTIDADGGIVMPGLIDCHTHTVYAGSRESEFAMRCAGKSYEEIARAGGGIRNTMKAVREASADALVSLAVPHLREMLQLGVTTVEIKSGYGLTVADEIKMLEAIDELNAYAPQEIVATYLAAHTIPPEYEDNADGYLDMMLGDEALGRVASEGLAEFCDVFCEGIAFDVPRSRRVLEAAVQHGLIPKVHADQISQMGASALAGELKAISADHLECVDDAGIAAMLEADTIGVLLPGCGFFLGTPQADARRLMAAGLPVAVATDYNPGSSTILSLPLVMSIACTQMKMSPIEVLVACTANAAAALNRQNRLGAIEPGYQADLAIIDMPNFDRFLYEVGRYPVRCVIQSGKVVFDEQED